MHINKKLTAVKEKISEKQVFKIIEAYHRVANFADTHTLDELATFALDEAEKLTGSKIGFFHLVEDDQLNLRLSSWSTKTLEKFCKTEAKGSHYPIEQAGVWVDCVHKRKPVIHNDYEKLKHKKGLPPGHAAIIRELVVPIIYQKKITAIMGVGNKKQNYTRNDVLIVKTFADMVWGIYYRKKMEEKKEILMKEIYHRVKNNLNVIISLMGLENMNFNNKLESINSAAEAIALSSTIFGNIEKKVRTISSLHELLYKNNVFDKVDIKAYIQKILQGNYTLNTNKLKIKLLEDIDDISIPVNNAIPIGLLINEAITNCFKYAWPETDTGELQVSLKSAGDNIQLIIKDNGIGIDKVKAAKSNSLGLTIMKTLAKQIGGKLEIHNGTGTTISLTFTLDTKKK